MEDAPPNEILDATCGGRSIWLPGNEARDDTLYIDRREEPPGFHVDGMDYTESYSIEPDEVQDFRDLPYADESFHLIVFDPPHVVKDGGMDALAGAVQQKYGALEAETWQADLQAGFEELWRVLKGGGVAGVQVRGQRRRLARSPRTRSARPAVRHDKQQADRRRDTVVRVLQTRT